MNSEPVLLVVAPSLLVGGLYCAVTRSLLFSHYHWLWRSNSSRWGDCGPATHYYSELSDSLPVSAVRVCSISTKFSLWRRWEVEPRPLPSGVCDVARYVNRDYKLIQRLIWSYFHSSWTSATTIEPCFKSIRQHKRMLLIPFTYNTVAYSRLLRACLRTTVINHAQ